MSKITALTRQKRNPDRVSVFLDGTFAFGLAYDVAAGLKVGQELTPDDIAGLEQHELYEKAKQSAYRYLSYRPRSVTEVERNLRDKGYEAAVIEQTISDLQEADLLDDEAFARFWVEQRNTFKPRSRFALQQELRQKGVSRRVIDRVLVDQDETAVARRAAQKKSRRWHHLPEESFKKKLGQFLQRRGFNYEITREVTNEMWQNIEEDQGGFTARQGDDL